MNCSEVKNELQTMTETRQDRLSDLATSHVQSCAACRRSWDDHQLINSAIRALRPVNHSVQMTESILRQLLVDSSPAPLALRRDSTLPRSRVQASSIVACVCVASLFLMFAVVTPRNEALRGLARRSTVPPVVAQSPVIESSRIQVSTSVAAVIDDLRAEYRELAAETSATARDLVAVLPPGVVTVWNSTNRLLPETSESLPAPRVGERGSTSGAVSSIGRSVGNQIGQAFGFLRAAVPETEPRG